jgi:hypothetical protein
MNSKPAEIGGGGSHRRYHSLAPSLVRFWLSPQLHYLNRMEGQLRRGGERDASEYLRSDDAAAFGTLVGSALPAHVLLGVPTLADQHRAAASAAALSTSR